MAKGEKQGCPPRVVRTSAAQPAMASSVNPHRQAAALTQAGVIGRPVRHPMSLARDVMTAVLVQLERHEGHPGFGSAIPYVTPRLSTTARSMHHAVNIRSS